MFLGDYHREDIRYASVLPTLKWLKYVSYERKTSLFPSIAIYRLFQRFIWPRCRWLPITW